MSVQIHQGDILKIEKIKHPVLVVSKDDLIHQERSLAARSFHTLLKSLYTFAFLLRRIQDMYIVRSLHC